MSQVLHDDDNDDAKAMENRRATNAGFFHFLAIPTIPFLIEVAFII